MRLIFLLAAILTFCAAHAHEPQLFCEPKWGEMEWEGMHFKRYRLRADHFPADQKYRLVVLSFDGTRTETFTYQANKKGHLIVQLDDPNQKDVYAVCPLKRGERITFLMQPEQDGQTYGTNVVIFPLQMQSKKGVTLSLELQGENGEQFALFGNGFKPEESVQITCRFNSLDIPIEGTVDASGALQAQIVLKIEEGSETQATVVIKRQKEEILFPFACGEPAIQIVGACCLQIK